MKYIENIAIFAMIYKIYILKHGGYIDKNRKIFFLWKH